MENEYFVFSLFNVAWLMSKGYKIEKIDTVDEGGRLAFFFNREKVEDAIHDMRADKEFQEFVGNFMAAKKMMFNKKK